MPIRDADVVIHPSSPSPGNCGGGENAREFFLPNKICGHETTAGRMISESTFPPQNFFLHTVASPLFASLFSEPGCIAATAKTLFSLIYFITASCGVDSVMVHTDKGGGAVSICMCTHKKKKGERDKNCVLVYHNHPGEKWPRDPGCCAGELLREGGVPIFLFALSCSAAGETKDRFRKPAENKP